jgi:hypothetical protein
VAGQQTKEKIMRTFSTVLALFLFATALPAQEQVAKSKIVAAGLFKNGLAVIKREIDLPGPGTVRLEDVPEPVHGTWWVESSAVVETTTKMREVEAPAGADVSFQHDLAGRKVTVHFKGGKPDPVAGTVVKMPRPQPEAVLVSLDRYGRAVHPVHVEAGAGRFLVLKTSKGRMFIDSADISILETDGAEPIKTERRPVLLVTAPKATKNDKLYVTYLTHGLAWAPSYRVDISDPKALKLELAAVVKNELSDLEGVELRLISGFPSVQFSHVRSPLSPLQTWSNFFQELSAGPQQRGHALLTQNAAMANNERPEFGIQLGALPQGEGVDLHFQPIGKRTLAKGEALSLSIARDKAAYERIVEWTISDNRDAHGRYQQRQNGGDDDHPWDALRFKNPFDFPMTTGPAMVTANGQFNGQRISYYVNAGEETMLRITKALSVRTRHVEQEVVGKNGERDYIWVGGHRYQKSTIAAELVVSNHRKEDVKLVVRRRFSGELMTAEGEPRTMLREEGAYSVNRRNEMVWVLPLKGGEERRLSYRYSVLVAH